MALNGDHTSKKYGFVCFQDPSSVQKCLDGEKRSEEFTVLPYNPRPKDQIKRLFNNVYVKNIPKDWDEAKLKGLFSQFGEITSCIMRTVTKDNEESKFGFVCFDKKDDREHGVKAANEAVAKLNDLDLGNGTKLYVKEALKKEDRLKELKKDVLRYKNSKKRCNLHVKNFLPTTTREELEEYFKQFGEIENIKLCSKEGEGVVYAFVCFKQPDQANNAKAGAHSSLFQGRPLHVNFYEIKEQRKIQQEDAKDKADFQNFKKQSPVQFNMDIINKPEMFQLIQTLLTYMNSRQGNNNRGYNNNQRPPR